VLAELGFLRACQGRLDEASVLWNRALAIAPGHGRTISLLSRYSGARPQ
jgi:hypothetical protein